MKKMLQILVVVMALTMLAAPALAEQPTATAYKATEPIVIDGNLEDWNTSSPIVINTEEQVIRDVSFWQGENDNFQKSFPFPPRRRAKRNYLLRVRVQPQGGSSPTSAISEEDI